MLMECRGDGEQGRARTCSRAEHPLLTPLPEKGCQLTQHLSLLHLHNWLFPTLPGTQATEEKGDKRGD